MHKLRVLLLGDKGQLGQYVKREWLTKFPAETNNDICVMKNFRINSIVDFEKILEKVESCHYDYIINCMAYTNVDKAETIDMNSLINEKLPAYLGWISKIRSIPIVHISTDMVFDGTSSFAYSVKDIPNPVNAYGKAKLDGERALLKQSYISTVIRTSWIFSELGNNFLTYMLKAKGNVNVFNQLGQPVSAKFIAEYIVNNIANNRLPRKLIHLTHDDPFMKNRYSFANYIKQTCKLDINLDSINIENLSLPAKRNYNCELCCYPTPREFMYLHIPPRPLSYYIEYHILKYKETYAKY